MNPIAVKYLAKINGKKSLNGKLLGMTIKRKCDITEPDINAFETLRSLADELEKQSKEFICVSGMQVNVVFDNELKTETSA